MRVLQIYKPGGPEVLELVELPTPEPGPREVRVRAEVIGVGRADVLVRRGTYKWMPPLPAIPGAEMVGVIDAVGDGVTALCLGQRVLVSARELLQRGGCYAEAICIPEDAGFLLPESIDPVDAASLPNFQFANALLGCNGGQTPTSILVLGSAGAVGAALAQQAASRGIQVVGTASTEDKRIYARANGVSVFVSSDPAEMAAQVMSVTSGRGVDMAFDHLGGDSIVACLHCLAPMGMLVSYNVIQGPPATDVFQVMRDLLGRSLSLRTFSMHTLDEDRTARRALMQQAIDDMVSNRIKAPEPLCFPLDQVRHAHQLLDARNTIGKVVLNP